MRPETQATDSTWSGWMPKKRDVIAESAADPVRRNTNAKTETVASVCSTTFVM